MNFITPNKLSFRLGVAAFIATVLGIVFTILCAKFLDLELSNLFILMAILVYGVTYCVFKKILQSKEIGWGIALKRGDLYEKFSGGSFLRFYMGYVWRISLINVAVTSVFSAIDPDSNMWGLSLFTTIFSIYLAVLWLVKFPYGSVEIVFNINHLNHIEAPQSENALETIDLPKEQFLQSEESIIDVVKGFFGGALMSIFPVLYLLMGLLQLAAIYSFFRHVWEWWLIPSMLAGGILAYVPLIGNIAGFYAAYTVWEWHWLLAGILFFWPIILFVAVLLMGMVGLIFEKKKL